MRFFFCLLFFFLTTSHAWATIPAAAQSNFRYSLGFLVCDYYANVSANGSTNNTSGNDDLNECAKDAYDNQLVAFLETCASDGVYMVNNMVKNYEWGTWNAAKGGPSGAPRASHNWRGSHACSVTNRPKIKLMATAPLFDNENIPRPVVVFRMYEALNATDAPVEPDDPLAYCTKEGGVVQCNGALSGCHADGCTDPPNFRDRASTGFYDTWEGIDIDTNGHDGAIAIAMPVAQMAALYNSTITATGSYAGIYNPPGRGSLTANIVITGGKFQILCGTSGLPKMDPTQGLMLAGITLNGGTNTTNNYFCNDPVPAVFAGFSTTKTTAGPAFKTTGPLVLVDGKIDHTSSAVNQTGVDNSANKFNLYAKNISFKGTTNLIENQNMTTSNGVGAWARVVELVYLDQFNKDGVGAPDIFPPYGVGTTHFEARSFINGVLGSAALPLPTTAVANNVSAPPSDLLTRHLWSADGAFPTFQTGAYEDPRTQPGGTNCMYTGSLNPEDGNTGTNCSTQMQAAINAANAAGHDRVVAPRGSLYVSASGTNPGLTFFPNTKLMGAGTLQSAIAYHNSWTPSAESYIIRSADSASGTASINNVQLFVRSQPQSTAWISPLHWRTGKSSYLISIGGKVQFNSDALPTNPLKFFRWSGNGGGKMYATHVPDLGSVIDSNAGFRILYCDNTTQPFAWYGSNAEISKGGANANSNFELNNCDAGTYFWGTKREGASRTLITVDSSNVGVFGSGAMSSPTPSSFPRFDFTGSGTNIFVANATPRDVRNATNGSKMLREELSGFPTVATIPWPNSLAVYVRGTLPNYPWSGGSDDPPRWLSSRVAAVDTTDTCFETLDGLAMLPASSVTGLTYTVDTGGGPIARVPTGTVRTGSTCFRSTFASGVIPNSSAVVVVSYTPGNITSGSLAPAVAFSGKTATNELSGATVAVLAHTHWQSFSLYSPTLDTGTAYFTEDARFPIPVNARLLVRMQVANTIAVATPGSLLPYVSTDGGAYVPLPDTCTGSDIAFADAPEFASGLPITAPRLTPAESTFTPGTVIETFAGAVPIEWPTPIDSITEVIVPIRICPTATTGQVFILHLHRGTGAPFASYDDANNTTPSFNIVTGRSRLMGGAQSGGSLK